TRLASRTRSRQRRRRPPRGDRRIRHADSTAARAIVTPISARIVAVSCGSCRVSSLVRPRRADLHEVEMQVDLQT
ncbi:MAG: hypothetical protein L0H79_19750, partial [Intrasporangium sp.]|uniref:hypothetical protein n=1 Tax=Intrasporangium sp. TaxID=1925024 RepID=UPI00264A2939